MKAACYSSQITSASSFPTQKLISNIITHLLTVIEMHVLLDSSVVISVARGFREDFNCIDHRLLMIVHGICHEQSLHSLQKPDDSLNVD